MVLEEKYFPPYALLTDEISFPDCLYFLRYWAIMCIVIICLLVCDVINSEINLRGCTLSMYEEGRRVLQIFQKKICSPGDHRAKYFMSQ